MERPQTDGLAERMVQVTKISVAKLVESEAFTRDEWNTAVAYIVLRCRASVAGSTGISPFTFLYAREPVLPGAIRQRCEQPLGLYDDDLEAVADDLLERAKLIKERMPLMENDMMAAQHRDRFYYARKRQRPPRLILRGRFCLDEATIATRFGSIFLSCYSAC